MAVDGGNDDCIFHISKSHALTYVKQENKKKFVESLERDFSALKQAKRYDIALRILTEIVSSRLDIAHLQLKYLDGRNLISKSSNFGQAGLEFLASVLDAFLKLGKLAKARGVLDFLLEKCSDANERSLQCRADYLTAVYLESTGQIAEACAEYKSAIKTCPDHVDGKELKVAASINLGKLLRKQGNYQSARKVLHEAEKTARAIDSPYTLNAKHNRALCIQFDGEFKNAEQIFGEVRDEARRLSDQFEYVSALHALANLSWHWGKPKEALKRYKTAFQKARELGFQEIVSLACNYGDALCWSKRYKKARDTLLVVREAAVNSSNEQYFFSSLASIFEELGQTKKAQKNWQQGLKHAREANDSFHVAECSRSIGAFHFDSGQFAKSVEYLEEAVEHEADKHVISHVSVTLLAALLETNQQREAENVFENIHSLRADIGSNINFVEALQAIAGFFWFEKRRRFKALQFLFHAMLESVDEVGAYEKICSSLVTFFFNMDVKERGKAIKRLRKKMTAWSVAQNKGQSLTDDVIEVLFWPFECGIDLATQDDLKTLTDKQVETIFYKHFEKATQKKRVSSAT